MTLSRIMAYQIAESNVFIYKLTSKCSFEIEIVTSAYVSVGLKIEMSGCTTK